MTGDFTPLISDFYGLEAELTAPKWWIRSSTKGGVIQIESKDEIRKRLGHSTDSADAVIHAFWIDGAPVHAGPGAGAAVPWQRSSDPLSPPQKVQPTGTGGSGMVSWRLEED